jgi:penicillin-binding protein 2
VASRIANGGVPIKPYLVRNSNIFKQYDALKNEPIVDRNLLKLVQEGMRKVINEPGGTAYGKRILTPGFEMAGKTGTSQVISKREDEMSKAEVANNTNQNHAIFVGFAPVSDPKYAISVVVEHGKSGSAAAAPIGKDVMLEVQNINKKRLFI